MPTVFRRFAIIWNECRDTTHVGTNGLHVWDYPGPCVSFYWAIRAALFEPRSYFSED